MKLWVWVETVIAMPGPGFVRVGDLRVENLEDAALDLVIVSKILVISPIIASVEGLDDGESCQHC